MFLINFNIFSDHGFMNFCKKKQPSNISTLLNRILHSVTMCFLELALALLVFFLSYSNPSNF